jgi:hypothetical protein
MRIVHKPVALAWRQRASSALRARAAATLPPAFMNNSHDFCPTRTQSSQRRGGEVLGIRVFHVEHKREFLRDREKIDALKWEGRAVSRKGKGICAQAGVAQF